jgi:hypothetical protein
MKGTSASYKKMFWSLVYVLAFPLATFAQQEPGWQGSRMQQSTTPVPRQEVPPSTVPQEIPPAIAPQESPALATQEPSQSHPQVMEMPVVQSPLPSVGQSALPPVGQSVPPLPHPQEETLSAHLPAQPAYLGVTGDTSPACRYPAGVRISRVIEGSPAHQAGLRGEGTLSWKEAVVGVLAVSPAALFIAPLLPVSEHSRWGDLLLAVDGKRIHNKEQFEQEMRHFRAGDVVYFSVLRREQGLKQVPVRLAPYPDVTTPAMQEARLTPLPPEW